MLGAQTIMLVIKGFGNSGITTGARGTVVPGTTSTEQKEKLYKGKQNMGTTFNIISVANKVYK